MKRWLLIPVLALFSAASAAAQDTGRVVGTVTSESGAPVTGASVLVVGTGLGTLTGEDGRFLIPNAPAGTRQIRVTIIGYTELVRPVNVVAGQTATINFRLTTQAVQLEGIVAVGYGQQQRRAVTGSVASVQAAQIKEVATSDPMKAIQGRVAGVEITAANNLPGSSMNVRIRGIRSITATNEPLFVVDGIPISGGIQDFNPASIQSVEILKDAAATAVYGSRGANGVILITTKTGAPGMPGGPQVQFSADMYSGWQRPLQLVDMMNMQQYTTMLQDAARYYNLFLSSGAPRDTSVNGVLDRNELRNAYAANQQTNWQDWLVKTGQQRNVQLGMTGLVGNTRFNISGNYFDQSGLASGQDYSRAGAV
ncbi:MAG TPA: TonB-dependent receptor plug domain-containing protein, partial [Longimicrobiales bacterium]